MALKFRIAVQDSEEAVQHVKGLIKDFDVEVYDIRKADIIDTASGEKMGTTCLLCCKGSAYNYLQLKTIYFDTEIKYEGFRTIM